MTIYDITWPLDELTPVYPGNPSFERVEKKGQTSVHSRISFGTHSGTHVDAPKHVLEGGVPIDALPLDVFIGLCRVIDVAGVEGSVKIFDLEQYNIQKGERILLKTKNSERGHAEWYDDYIYLDGDAADWLAAKEIALFGIDYLSVKQRGGADNRAHTALLQNGIGIIEGLDFSQVSAGEYELICLPLNIKNADGAPARAVLLKR
ncbi:MAG: kynurenine formamidase [Candidatus Lloydbacteria bacterium CG22_combo_CG10-13_8_21_14_all_47_15]|uniref:Kynurenine formamidase n=1 Tax=Candidatus Lloydbacteria bacterium CG22_combo_CG10-13_8_21_14_all_47_15 TaxID=1974635 RepID=A0A2H0CW70_9BACT|nr:MAG: kynurenine formamidase [Candidatus Lloydbacteria bacterium CG22_combo_CG10-13_8_21_14_all_47_15]